LYYFVYRPNARARARELATVSPTVRPDTVVPMKTPDAYLIITTSRTRPYDTRALVLLSGEKNKRRDDGANDPARVYCILWIKKLFRFYDARPSHHSPAHGRETHVTPIEFSQKTNRKSWNFSSERYSARRHDVIDETPGVPFPTTGWTK